MATLAGLPSEVGRDRRVLSEDEVAKVAARISSLSHQSLGDMALFYLLLATGARPMEVARLDILDYLNADGPVLRKSSLRAEFAINVAAVPSLSAARASAKPWMPTRCSTFGGT